MSNTTQPEFTVTSQWRGEKDMPLEDYLKAPGISKHDLDDFAKSPAYYMDKQTGRVKEPDRVHNRVGKCLHELFFERKQTWVEKPESWTTANGEPTTSGNCTEAKAWVAAHKDDTILTRDQAGWILETVETMRADRYIGMLPKTGKFETSLFAYDPDYNVLLRTRPDWRHEGVYVDLKSTTDASTEQFSRDIFKYRYHVQAAMVRRVARLLGMPFEHYYYIAVEKSNPARINVRELNPTAIDAGNFWIEGCLSEMAECTRTGFWPDYSGRGERIEYVDIPVWAYSQLNQNDEPLVIGGKEYKI